MGSWLRNLSGYRRYLQQESTIIELKREFPELSATPSRSKIPDPWDDFPRRDAYDRCWKRHRKTKYRVKKESKPRRAKVKVTYDTFWVGRGGRWYWMSYSRKFGEGHISRNDARWIRYRVRESYRRHRADK